ncbi:TPA: hypothetical protein ACQ0F8_001611 [Streptococcus agalactiae]|nr:hypothetical protein [Streptococcus agalactiae]HEO4177420.1 hypothetical protein [Streptococcus agalactiae]
MDDNKDVKSFSSWGMPRGMFRGLKYYGVTAIKAFIVVISFIFALQVINKFPNDQQVQKLLFLLLVPLLATYLVLPTRSGGTNANAIFYFHTHRKRRYYSIERSCYPELEIKKKYRTKMKNKNGKSY